MQRHTMWKRIRGGTASILGGHRGQATQECTENEYWAKSGLGFEAHTDEACREERRGILALVCQKEHLQESGGRRNRGEKPCTAARAHEKVSSGQRTVMWERTRVCTPAQPHI